MRDTELSDVSPAQDDEWTPRIADAFPTCSGSHEAYATAMTMVGNRSAKGDFVALVNWLLVERDVEVAQ